MNYGVKDSGTRHEDTGLPASSSRQLALACFPITCLRMGRQAGIG
jgi:hypothetical protein